MFAAPARESSVYRLRNTFTCTFLPPPPMNQMLPWDPDALTSTTKKEFTWSKDTFPRRTLPVVPVGAKHLLEHVNGGEAASSADVDTSDEAAVTSLARQLAPTTSRASFQPPPKPGIGKRSPFRPKLEPNLLVTPPADDPAAATSSLRRHVW